MIRTPPNAIAPAGRPGRSLLTCGRARFARAHEVHAAFGRGSEVVRAKQASNRKLDFSSLGGLDDPSRRIAIGVSDHVT
jgi:hypothetical protein